jgi:hypothetical protein
MTKEQIGKIKQWGLDRRFDPAERLTILLCNIWALTGRELSRSEIIEVIEIRDERTNEIQRERTKRFHRELALCD